MTVTVRYTCPHCNAMVNLERPPDLADRSVTTVRQPGWEYASPDDPERESADGIEFVCGEDGPVTDLEGESLSRAVAARSISISCATSREWNSSPIRQCTVGRDSISTRDNLLAVNGAGATLTHTVGWNPTTARLHRW